MNKLAAFFKDIKTIVGGALFLILLLVTFGGWLARLEVKAGEGAKSMEKYDELQQQIVDNNTKMIERAEKDRDFLFALWGMNPDEVKKWSKVPLEPDSLDEFSPWWEFEVNGLLRYQVGMMLSINNDTLPITVDTTRVLYVDTVYWREKK